VSSIDLFLSKIYDFEEIYHAEIKEECVWNRIIFLRTVTEKGFEARKL